MRAVRGSPFVRETARFDTGYRLHVFVAQWQRHQSEGLASERSSRSEDTRAAAHGCGPAPVKRAVRIGTERRLPVRGGLTVSRLDFGSRARRSESGPRNTCLPSGNGSTRPRYGRRRSSILRADSMRTWRNWKRATFPTSGLRVRSPSSAPCDRSVSGKHATSPRLQGEFESRRSLASRTSPTGRGAWFRSRRFAVRIRGSVRKVNRTGVPGSPAKRCAGYSASFECSAFRSWRMNQPGGWPRPESGWRVTP
jgi:hypothetical protein